MKTSTPRQKEAQRLWQQRGTLERTKQNLRTLYWECKKANRYESAAAINRAGLVIHAMILENKELMSTISKRIPA